MTEQLAPGKFSWCKLQIEQKDGSVVDENRTDSSWWDSFDKSNINRLTIIPINTETGDKEGISLRLDNYPERINKFFYFLNATILFGLTSGIKKIKDVSCVIGLVTDEKGNAIIIEMFPDHTVKRSKINVLAMKLNLEQQGIDLSEGW